MKKCSKCQEEFTIHKRDKEFYKSLNLPEPTLCPLCRQKRRLSFRNERNLYQDKCTLSETPIISMYNPNNQYTVYSQKTWWSDQWDGIKYGQEFNFNRSFFDQFSELDKKTPKINLLNINAENSQYCNYTGDVKNCYLVFGPVYSENCYYGSPYYSNNCVDNLVIRECELCYECIDSRKLYKCFFCQNCTNSSNLIFCEDLHGCQECIACCGLRQKKHYILNKPYSKEDYFKLKKQLNLEDKNTIHKLKSKLKQAKENTPHRYMQSNQVQNVTGDYIFNSKNTFDSFFADRCEDCSYCAQVVDLKNCYDNNYTEENELCHEYLGMYGNYKTIFSLFCRHCEDVYYTNLGINLKNCFGCSSLKNKSYCILNKQYTKEEYEQLIPKIIHHMQETGEWGEFFPQTLSPFKYEETVANEYWPKTPPSKHTPKKSNTNPSKTDPSKEETPICRTCSNQFKLIPQEKKFYQNQSLANPENCPNCRHQIRLEQRNPRKLFGQRCNRCDTNIKTTYPPTAPETILCEKCYLEEVY